jgi:hypothetical protein
MAAVDGDGPVMKLVLFPGLEHASRSNRQAKEVEFGPLAHDQLSTEMR